MARRPEDWLTTTPSAASSPQTLRWPQAAHCSACLAASGWMRSTTGAGHGPLPGRGRSAPTAARHRYQLALGMPNRSQKPTTLRPAWARITSRSSTLGRPPPLLRHTRSCTWASPRALVRSSTCAWSSAWWALGPWRAPAASAARPPSRNWSRQAAIEVSETPLTAGRLLDRDLAAQHRQHDAQLVIDRLDRWSRHRTPSRQAKGSRFAYLRNPDAGHEGSERGHMAAACCWGRRTTRCRACSAR